MNSYRTLFFLIIIILLTAFMIINPNETVTAAASGFKLWYSILIPALLPFFIVAELLVNLGLVRFLGMILEPLIRPIFRLPGCSSIVIVMGFTSGFPMGAVLSKKLYEEKMLSADETERLVAFTNNSSPLFIIGAVGIGMFGSPLYGYLLAFAHYFSNLLVGILLRFKVQETRVKSSFPSSYRVAWSTLVANAPNNIGTVLSNSIKNSLNNIIAIAGFIIFFSVLVRMLIVWGLIDWFSLIIANLIPLIIYPVAYGFGIGFFEITLGINTLSFTNSTILTQLLAVSILLSFGGLSIIAQVMGILANIPVRLSFYIKARLAQILLSAIITYIGYYTFLDPQNLASAALPYYKILYGFDAWGFSLTCLIIGLSTMVVLLLTAGVSKN